MRIQVTETPVYTWDELSPAAKDKARENWSRFLWEDGTANENMQMIFDDLMESEGWSHYGDLTYSLYMQGGEPMWTGELPRFEHDGRVYSVSVMKRGLGGSSYAWDVRLFDEEDETDAVYGTPEWDAEVARIEAVEEAVKDYCRELSARLLDAFVKEDEYMVADEQMADNAEANGYEYTADGELA